MTPSLYRLAGYLAGDFSNREQAWENPPFFAHIWVSARPLPWTVLDGVGFYIEQAYSGYLGEPYRTAVFQLLDEPGGIRIRNFRPLDPSQWLGCSRDRKEGLSRMTLGDLDYLQGCDVLVTEAGEAFIGVSEPGNGCCVVRKGKTTYQKISIRVTATEYSSLDQGMDPETHEQVWGSVAGPFLFQKKADWSADLPSLPPTV